MDREDKQKQLVIDFISTFGTPEGKRVYANLRKESKSDIVIIPLDSNGRVDIHKVMLNNGQRSIVTYIDSVLAKDPNKVKQKEARD